MADAALESPPCWHHLGFFFFNLWVLAAPSSWSLATAPVALFWPHALVHTGCPVGGLFFTTTQANCHLWHTSRAGGPHACLDQPHAGHLTCHAQGLSSQLVSWESWAFCITQTPKDPHKSSQCNSPQWFIEFLPLAKHCSRYSDYSIEQNKGLPTGNLHSRVVRQIMTTILVNDISHMMMVAM